MTTNARVENHWARDPQKRAETIAKFSKSLRGRSVWNTGLKGVQVNLLKGKKMPLKWAEKARIGRIGRMWAWNKSKTSLTDKRVIFGSKHYAWKDSEVGRKALHQWVRRSLGEPMKCEKCGIVVRKTTRIHWANKSGKYKRELTDWMRLCVPCHKRYDLSRLKL